MAETQTTTETPEGQLAQNLSEAIVIVTGSPSDTSRPFFMSECRLRNLHAQQVLQRSYAIGAESMFRLSIILPAMVNNQAIAEQALKAPYARMDELRKDLNNEIARLTKLADTNGISTETLQYSAPQTFSVQITTPRGGDLIRTIKLYDDMLQLLDVLWLAGVVSQAEYGEYSHSHKRALLRMLNFLHYHSNAAFKAANEYKDKPKVLMQRLAALSNVAGLKPAAKKAPKSKAKKASPVGDQTETVAKQTTKRATKTSPPKATGTEMTTDPNTLAAA